MNYFKSAVIGLSTLLLFACGGGGSSSGGSSEPIATPSIDGTYTGTWTATFSAPEVPSLAPETTDISITIKITGNQVEITETGFDDFVSTGTLSASNGFDTTSSPDTSVTDGSITCTGATTFSGAVVGERITGSGRSLLRCTEGGISLNILSEGPFTADKSSAKSSASASFSSALSNFIR